MQIFRTIIQRIDSGLEKFQAPGDSDVCEVCLNQETASSSVNALAWGLLSGRSAVSLQHSSRIALSGKSCITLQLVREGEA